MGKFGILIWITFDSFVVKIVRSIPKGEDVLNVEHLLLVDLFLIEVAISMLNISPVIHVIEF